MQLQERARVPRGGNSNNNYAHGSLHQHQQQQQQHQHALRPHQRAPSSSRFGNQLSISGSGTTMSSSVNQNTHRRSAWGVNRVDSTRERFHAEAVQRVSSMLPQQ
jgi:hypothetical protein